MSNDNRNGPPPDQEEPIRVTAEIVDDPQHFEDEEPHELLRIDQTALAAINKSEVESQLAAAHLYPRSIGKFIRDAKSMATVDQETAASCMYAVERGRNPDGSKKFITGPSVRLAEICASAFGNLHVGSRIVDEDERFITAQSVAWDLEKNVRMVIENRRKITGKQGRKFTDDMIGVTGNAASSIALRNAIFRVVPRAYVNQIYNAARMTAIGDAKTLTVRRQDIMDRFQKMGVELARVLGKLGKATIDDVTIGDLEVLIGLGTAIKNGEANVDEVFPVVAPVSGIPQGPEGQRMSMGRPPATTANGPETPPGAQQTSQAVQNPPPPPSAAQAPPPAPGPATFGSTMAETIRAGIGAAKGPTNISKVRDGISGAFAGGQITAPEAKEFVLLLLGRCDSAGDRARVLTVIPALRAAGLPEDDVKELAAKLES